MTWGKNDQHSKIYLSCNFEVNLIIHLGVIALFSSHFPLRMIQAKFGLNWPSGFRGEDFLKSLQTDDGHQVMAIAHLTLGQVS
jgi:hypothetical protein